MLAFVFGFSLYFQSLLLAVTEAEATCWNLWKSSLPLADRRTCKLWSDYGFFGFWKLIESCSQVSHESRRQCVDNIHLLSVEYVCTVIESRQQAGAFSMVYQLRVWPRPFLHNLHHPESVLLTCTACGFRKGWPLPRTLYLVRCHSCSSGQ